jgi:hypothetical protein
MLILAEIDWSSFRTGVMGAALKGALIPISLVAFIAIKDWIENSSKAGKSFIEFMHAIVILGSLALLGYVYIIIFFGNP